MRRRIAMILGAVLAASALAVVAPAPASATDVCAGVGTAQTGPLYYPVTVDPTIPQVTVRQPSTVGFNFALNIVWQCVASDGTPKQLVAGGRVTGWCGHSSGQGTANDGANFAWISAGTFLVVTGHVVGIVNAIPNQPAGESCLTGALEFIVTGVAVLLHCGSILTIPGLFSALVTIPIPETLTLPIPFFHIHTGPMSYHYSVCIPGPL